MAKKEEVIIDDPIERHNRKVELIKNDLNHINTLLDKLYRKAEPIPEPSELKEVKMSDLNEIRSKLNLMNEVRDDTSFSCIVGVGWVKVQWIKSDNPGLVRVLRKIR